MPRHFEVSKKTLRNYVRVDSRGCWIWQRSTRGKGYAQITDPQLRRQDFGHRVVWRMFYGQIPAGLLVCHKCDIRLCVNPKHLELGTHLKNQRDLWLRNPNCEQFRKARSKRAKEGLVKEAFARGRALGAPKGCRAAAVANRKRKRVNREVA